MKNLAAVIIVFVFYSVQASAEEMRGPATIIDAERLKIGTKIFRLAGIKTPEPGQICQNRSGKDFDCGKIAATGLMDLTAGAIVTCTPLGGTVTDSQLANCNADGYDLSEGMVYTGWAFPTSGLNVRLNAAMTKAKSRKYGLWAGTF